MATETITLGDIRAAAKDEPGILIGGWTPGDPRPLPEPLQEMADDILTWFNSDQGWRLAEVRTGFINARRIADSHTGTGGVRLRAKKTNLINLPLFSILTPKIHPEDGVCLENLDS